MEPKSLVRDVKIFEICWLLFPRVLAVLFVCLFDDAASNSGCLALNGRMIDEFDRIEKEGGWFCA